MPPELARPLPLAAVPASGRSERIVATSAECAALAARFGVLAIERLEAALRLDPAEDGGMVAIGGFEAAVLQTCVVTLEPVAQDVVEAIRWRFLPRGVEPEDGPDDVDEIPTDGVADLGEALAEQLSLALDPYPRAPGATLPDAGEAGPSGPFAQLLPLRRRD